MPYYNGIERLNNEIYNVYVNSLFKMYIDKAYFIPYNIVDSIGWRKEDDYGK